MANEFRKLIQKEFGNPIYHKFVLFFQDKMESGKLEIFTDNEESITKDDIYIEMYDMLKGKDNSVLMKMQKRLADTMITAMGICKSYLIVILLYALSMMFIFVNVANPAYMYLGMTALTLLYLYKTIQYVSNKFCFIDAQLVMIYKTVLDRLLSCAD